MSELGMYAARLCTQETELEVLDERIEELEESLREAQQERELVVNRVEEARRVLIRRVQMEDENEA